MHHVVVVVLLPRVRICLPLHVWWYKWAREDIRVRV